MLKKKKKKVETVEEIVASGTESQRFVLVGTYKKKPDQLAWIRKRHVYNYPLSAEEAKLGNEGWSKVKELWLYSGTKDRRHIYEAVFVGIKPYKDFLAAHPDYPTGGARSRATVHGDFYAVFSVKHKYQPTIEDSKVVVRAKDFAKRTPKIAQAVKAYQAGGELGSLRNYIPVEIAPLSHDQLRICETTLQLELFPFESAVGEGTCVLPSERISAAKAMQILSLSRHSYDKLVLKGIIVRHKVGDDSYFLLSEVERAKTSCEYIDMRNGIVDRRNTLNDLTGKDWIPETKSYLYQKGLGADSSEAQIERMHPAPYSFQDIGHLIRFFTKRGMRVLDPFGGVGSTAKACEIDGRLCTSIELSPKWHELSVKRLEVEIGSGASKKHNFINGDSCEVLPVLDANSVDFVVTSPPYWGILNKQDQKVKRDRVSNNLDTRYSDDARDLGNVSDYREFLDILVEKVFLQCARVLKLKKYMAIVVSDFRDKSQFVSFHSDLIVLLNNTEIPGGGILRLQGTKILIQNHKSLLPYGYPFAYVENIHHQYILIFKKDF